MKRPVRPARCRPMSAAPTFGRCRPPGYTLVEILVATALTLIMMGVAVQIFGLIGENVADSRATLEMADRARAAVALLRTDLAGVTVTMLPPRRPETAEGYFEYKEGPMGVDPAAVPQAVNSDSGNTPDTTVGDFDDILMFTVRSAGRPFVGRVLVKRAPLAGELPDGNDANGPYVLVRSAESDIAEVAWFVRGRTLYRRVLLVRPQLDLDLRTPARDAPAPPGFYHNYDLSIHWDGSNLVANTLGDLTKRECRYAHDTTSGPNSFPFDARGWGQLGLPTLRECSHPNWNAGAMAPISVTPAPAIDFWNHPHPWDGVDKATGTLLTYMGPRVAEDVVLTNVIGFDVKAWDPGAPVKSDGSVALGPSDPGYSALGGAPVVSYGAYVNLGYAPGYSPAPNAPAPHFQHTGDPRSGLTGTAARPARVYDTWSFHYEHDGIDQDGDGVIDEGTNGFDDDNNGIVDDPGEMETSPPYPVPLRGIQVKLRIYEPDSRQIREVTVVQDFLPK